MPLEYRDFVNSILKTFSISLEDIHKILGKTVKNHYVHRTIFLQLFSARCQILRERLDMSYQTFNDFRSENSYKQRTLRVTECCIVSTLDIEKDFGRVWQQGLWFGIANIQFMGVLIYADDTTLIVHSVQLKSKISIFK